jgi:hypothetical protein
VSGLNLPLPYVVSVTALLHSGLIFAVAYRFLSTGMSVSVSMCVGYAFTFV